MVDRLVGEKRWTRIAKGLYLTSDRKPDWNALAWGGVLLGGGAARLGGAAAGHLHGLNEAPDVIEVLVPRTADLAKRGPWHFVRERPGVRSGRSIGSPPRLCVEDTVVDLCQRASEGHVIDLVTKAVQTRRTTAKRLLACISQRTRVRHRLLLEQILADVADGAHSPLELKYVRDVERAHDLPKGNRQLSGRRGKDYRDVTYEGFALVVELDGRVGHEGLGRFRDMRRDNAALLTGLATLRYGWCDVIDRPCRVADEVATILASRGWTGSPSLCDRCQDCHVDRCGDLQRLPCGTRTLSISRAIRPGAAGTPGCASG